jgi:hypothetical protein
MSLLPPLPGYGETSTSAPTSLRIRQQSETGGGIATHIISRASEDEYRLGLAVSINRTFGQSFWFPAPFLRIKGWFLNTKNVVRSIKNAAINTKNGVRNTKNVAINTRNGVRNINDWLGSARKTSFYLVLWVFHRVAAGPHHR